MTIRLPFPITMRGVIDHCVLVSLRTPARTVEGLVPPGLRLITKPHPSTGEPFAFWNVVLCHIRRMRPVLAPRSLGVSYHHVAHRLMVEADDESPRGESPVQGLFFVRSDADSRAIVLAGNPASEFRFNAALIDRAHAGDVERWRVRSRDHAADLDASFTDADSGLGEGSLFSAMDEARSFLKYRPTGLAPDGAAGPGRRLRLAEVFREESDWDERPIGVATFRSHTLEAHGGGAVELATRVAPIDYRWRLGKTVRVESA